MGVRIPLTAPNDCLTLLYDISEENLQKESFFIEKLV